MYDPDRIWEDLDEISHGKVRLDAIHSAILQADKEGDYETGFILRDELIRESVFYNDYMDAYIIFPEYFAMCEKYPDLNEEYSWNVIWKFKWIIDNAVCFYQISMKETEKYLDTFKQMSEKLGYSLRTYYCLMFRVYKYSDLEKANEYYERFQAEPRDELSDCKACELSSEIHLQLLNGREAEAFELFKPLADGRYSCTEQPSFTYARFGEFYYNRGEYKKAEDYYKKFYKAVTKDGLYSDEIGNVVSCYAFTNPDKALKVFLKFFPRVLESREPSEITNFAIGACHLWKQVALKMGKNTLMMSLPQQFELYREDGDYDLNELYEYFFKQAEKVGYLLDESNLSDEYTNKIRKLKGMYQ